MTLACVASGLPLSHDSRTTTGPHNPLFIYCTGGIEVPKSLDGEDFLVDA